MENNIVDILLIEDDPNDAELTMRELNKNKIVNNIVYLKDGDQGLSYFFEDNAKVKDFLKPKIILLDLNLPKISGIEVLRRLKSNANTKHIPIIVMTSSKENSDLSRCYELGVNSYIVKPLDFECFSTVVRDIGLYWIIVNEPPILSTF